MTPEKIRPLKALIPSGSFSPCLTMLVRALLLLWLFIASPLRADEIRIAAAADLRFALDEIISTFKQRHPNEHIDVSYGSSGKFHSQIQNGAPFDLFFSADIGLPRSLARQARPAAKCAPTLSVVLYSGIWVVMAPR